MANHNGSASIADAPPQDPYSIPMSINVADIVEEDEDEYEYEYSSTEKEIFYVTLDLTTPNVPVKRKLAQTHPRRNAKKWLNPGLGKHRRHLGDSTTIVIDKEKPARAKGKAKGKSAKKSSNVEEEDDDEPAEGEEVEEPLEDETAQPVSTSKPVEVAKKSTGEQYSNFIADTKRGGEAPATLKPEVQILGLHEDNPVVSYEGNIYQCRWEENMGTELLFTAHDPNSKLPILQSVSNEVDLLAASSARITSVNTKVEDKDPTGGPGVKRRNYFWRSGNIRELKIPVGVAASEQRKNQAFFLQSLIQIKESKRERDHVTVMARRRNTNRQWRAIMKQKQAAEVAQIRKAMATGKMSQADGKQRLDQMAKDNEILAAEDKLRGIGPDGRKIRHGGRKKTVNADKQIVRRPPGGLTNYLMNNAAPEDEDGMDTGLDGVADMTPRSYSIGEDEDMGVGDYGMDDDAEMNDGVEYEYGEDGEMTYEDDAGFEEDYEIE